MKPNKEHNFIEVQSWVTKDILDVAQLAFLASDPLGFEIDDGILPDGSNKYHHDKILIKAYFPDQEHMPGLIAEKFDNTFIEYNLKSEPIKFIKVMSQDWQKNFVDSCKPFIIKPCIHIVPSFFVNDYKDFSFKDIVIQMDPENAFGTGQHQTTKLCVQKIYALLNGKNNDKLSCLDVGTGSGILSILMKKLGAGLVYSSETDTDALDTAQKNAFTNKVALTPIAVDESYHYCKDNYDLVVANIMSHVLIDMKDNLSNCLRSGGKLLLSGILDTQLKGVIDAYEQKNFTVIDTDKMDDWCCLLLEKNRF